MTKPTGQKDQNRTAEVWLDRFSTTGFDRGASRFKEALWVGLGAPILSSFFPGSRWRVRLLRAFGARIGRGTVWKPGVKVKFPWYLIVGDHSWIGENAWIDNLAQVVIGSHVCISQGAYLCTGSHDWSSQTFDLITKPITICDHAWIGARAILSPGTKVGEGSIVALGGVCKGELTPWTVHYGGYVGQPKPRRIS